ncbi:MAG: aspartate-semialdehyde dehydrogenase [Gammaproteobacteria bacterium]|nr:aspartate-semialdehyde dehydrogenase [Gammaproteobacteria bacterium]
MKSVNVAVAGATGAVGEVLREMLAERRFPVDRISLLASSRSKGKSFEFDDKQIDVEVLDEFDFSDTQIAFFSAGGEVSAAHAPRAAEAGTIVVDNTSKFRQESHIPLIVPEVNRRRLEDGLDSRIIANPNCSTIQMVVALKPIYDAVGIDRINVSTYQAVSGAGASGVHELADQTSSILNGNGAEVEVHAAQIAFNVVPQIGDFHENGFTTEEWKMVLETQKIFEDESIKVNPTCVRVPVFYGHSEAVHIETREPISVDFARELLKTAEGVELIDEQKKGGYPTAIDHSAGTDPVFVGRLRKDPSHPRGLDMWVVSDNVRKGAALNSIQIAEELLPLLN